MSLPTVLHTYYCHCQWAQYNTQQHRKHTLYHTQRQQSTFAIKHLYKATDYLMFEYSDMHSFSWREYTQSTSVKMSPTLAETDPDLGYPNISFNKPQSPSGKCLIQ